MMIPRRALLRVVAVILIAASATGLAQTQSKLYRLTISNPGTGDFETWVMNSDGSHAHPLTASVGKDQGAMWSPNGRRIVLYLSRLDRVKGLDILLRAFADVHRAEKGTSLVIAGDGEPQLASDLRAWVR